MRGRVHSCTRRVTLLSNAFSRLNVNQLNVKQEGLVNQPLVSQHKVQRALALAPPSTPLSAWQRPAARAGAQARPRQTADTARTENVSGRGPSAFMSLFG